MHLSLYLCKFIQTYHSMSKWNIIATTIQIKSEMVLVFSLKSKDPFYTNSIEAVYLLKKLIWPIFFFCACVLAHFCFFFLGMLFYCILPNHILNTLVSEFPILLVTFIGTFHSVVSVVHSNLSFMITFWFVKSGTIKAILIWLIST